MKKKINKSRGDVLFDIFNYTVLTVLMIIVLYPLIFVLSASISDPNLVNTGKVILLPKGLNFSGYKRLFSYTQLWQGYGMSILYTVLGTMLNLFLTMTVAYTLSVKNYFGRKFLYAYIMLTMYFGGGLIPYYTLVKNIGLYNNFFTLIVLGGINVFNVIVAKSFLEGSVPGELFEAASIDGCSHFVYFAKIVLPLSKPILAVLVLYYGVAHWNDYMTALIYIDERALYPLQLILRNILIEGEMLASDVFREEEAMLRQQEAELIKYGLIVVSSVPLLVIYPFLQKYFKKGAMIGSVKA